MPTGDDAIYTLRIGQAATFSGDWLAYRPDRHHPEHVRYLEGYHGWLQAVWNGAAEFTVDRDAARAIVNAFADTAEYVSGSWQTVAFDQEVLTLRIPWSLGGGLSSLRPLAGRYRIGWGMRWLPVDPGLCDRVVGNRTHR
jgi:hypothetical protein